MQIKQAQARPILLIDLKALWQHRAKRILVAGAAAAALLVALAAGASMLYANRDHAYQQLVVPALEVLRGDLVHVPQHMAAGLLAQPEHIVIDVKHPDMLMLAYKREQALAMGYLAAEDTDYVPATIRHGDQSLRVKLRLKGDWLDQLQGDKWSYRVKVSGDNTLFGMKQLSLQHPRTRNYIYEWVYHQALKREGVIGLRYDFVRVTLNGKDLGVYALEEHFEKRLIENNGLREGPIVRFDEGLMWAERFQQHRKFPDAQRNENGAYLSSAIDTFQTAGLLADPVARSQLEGAVHLLEAFRRGDLKTSEVFDVEKLAKFMAITDLMGTDHGSYWHNVRYYFNPITAKLEPIGFDGSSRGRPIRELRGSPAGTVIDFDRPQVHDDLRPMLFSDPVFFGAYVKQLERISEPAYLDAVLADLHDELERKLRILYGEYPYTGFSEDLLRRNQEYIRTVLNPVKGLQAYYRQAGDGRLELSVGNIHALPIEVLGATYKGTPLPPTRRVILPARLPSQAVDYRPAVFRLPQGLAWTDPVTPELQVDYRLLGASQARQEAVYPWAEMGDLEVETGFLRQAANVARFGFLEVDEQAKVIRVMPGSWELAESLFVPPGYRFVAPGGTTLTLSNAANIVSFSPLELIGSEEQPVVIQSPDASGQGVVVIDAQRRSILDHVQFVNLTNPAKGDWQLTGAVTFYQSPVQISHARFIRSRSEDALNVFRSTFGISQTLFADTGFDAFDADFSNGSFFETSFASLGNDAIDVSGSVVDVRDVFVNGSGDKGLSAGENSQVTVDGLEMRNAAIGIASKDLSTISLRDVRLSAGQIGLTAFRKKPEFGEASITAEGLEVSGVDIPYLVENGSTVVVNGEPIDPSRENVAEILYGVEHGKASG
jgi:hypothetical protein